MDKYKEHNYNYLMEHNNRYVRDQNPSFSSTLLDQIYRSIDETNDHKGTVKTVKKMKKQFIHTPVEAQGEAKFQRIEKRKDSEKMTKSTSEKSAASTTDRHMYTRKTGEKYGSSVNLNSSWSSSDSSSGALFSSEAESNYGVSSRPSSATTCRPKPVKTNTDIEKFSRDEERDHESGGVVKRSKLRALKIYGELKKAKQPISPGAKLASFLNSLFTTGGGNVKKGKISGADSSNASPACSTSRSCLSKSPGKLSNNGTKRSVRFYPVSVIVDEDCGHNGHGIKNIPVLSDNKICKNEELRHHMMRRKDQSVEEAARELLKNYQRKVECQMEHEEDEDDDDDDDASYASSDLFELDNLNNDNYDGIHVLGNYMEELPVYETTYLDTNRAIAINSLVV